MERRHDRRLSVSKSPFKLTKLSSTSSSRRPPSNSRPPPTFVSADLDSFRDVVQQLTGTSPAASLSSSPARDSSTQLSRLQRIAPPSLRPFLRQQSDHGNLQLLPPRQCNQSRHSIEDSTLRIKEEQCLRLHSEPHQRTTVTDPSKQRVVDANRLEPRHEFSWLSSVEPLSPPLPYSLLASRRQEGIILPSPFTDQLPYALPLLPCPSSNGYSLLGPSTSNMPPLQNPLPSFTPSSLLPSPSTYKQPLFLQGEPLLPSPHAAQLPSLPPLPVSPYTLLNPWISPWPSSPFLPLPFSPGSFFPPSPLGLSPFISSPPGFSFRGTSPSTPSSLDRSGFFELTSASQ